jgi:hypothetical protein
MRRKMALCCWRKMAKNGAFQKKFERKKLAKNGTFETKNRLSPNFSAREKSPISTGKMGSKTKPTLTS